MKNLLFVITLTTSSFAWAGIFEISTTYNYKKTNYGIQVYEESESGTGSIAYYFWGMSGLELSVTRGRSVLSQQVSSTVFQMIFQDLTAYGVNFLFTIANTNSTVKPYIKAGGAYIIKNIRNYYSGFNPPNLPNTLEGIAPSVGFGLKIAIGPQFELKGGVDASTSPLNNNQSVTYDFGLNAGLGFLF